MIEDCYFPMLIIVFFIMARARFVNQEVCALQFRGFEAHDWGICKQTTSTGLSFSTCFIYESLLCIHILLFYLGSVRFLNGLWSTKAVYWSFIGHGKWRLSQKDWSSFKLLAISQKSKVTYLLVGFVLIRASSIIQLICSIIFTQNWP